MYLSTPDTIEVEDPVTRAIHKKNFPKDSNGLRTVDVQNRIYDTTVCQYIVRLLDIKTWHIHKADLDGNGYSDLVIDIDTAGVTVVMDMGNRFEGHILLDNRDFISYSFKGFMTLPDGSTALLLRHNPCTLAERSKGPAIVSYITENVTDVMDGKGIIKTDTLYKVITMIDSIYLWKGDVPSYSHRWVNSDTIDMRRYNLTDTIVYKFNAFVKYNPNPLHADIAKISYHQLYEYNHKDNACVEINANGECYLHYDGYDTTFSARVDKTKLKNLWDLAEYLDIKLNNYSDPGNNAAVRYGNVFVVHFGDGTTKEIVFGKCIPPIGLGYLSEKIADISINVDWQPSEKCVDDLCPCEQRPVVKWSGARCDCESIDEVW